MADFLGSVFSDAVRPPPVLQGCMTACWDERSGSDLRSFWLLLRCRSHLLGFWLLRRRSLLLRSRLLLLDCCVLLLCWLLLFCWLGLRSAGLGELGVAAGVVARGAAKLLAGIHLVELLKLRMKEMDLLEPYMRSDRNKILLSIVELQGKRGSYCRTMTLIKQGVEQERTIE